MTSVLVCPEVDLMSMSSDFSDVSARNDRGGVDREGGISTPSGRLLSCPQRVRGRSTVVPQAFANLPQLLVARFIVHRRRLRLRLHWLPHLPLRLAPRWTRCWRRGGVQSETTKAPIATVVSRF